MERAKSHDLSSSNLVQQRQHRKLRLTRRLHCRSRLLGLALAFPVASTVVVPEIIDQPVRTYRTVEVEVLEAKRIGAVSGMAPNTFSTCL